MAYLIQIGVFCGSMFAVCPFFYGTPFDNKFAYIAVGTIAAWLSALVAAHWRPPTS